MEQLAWLKTRPPPSSKIKGHERKDMLMNKVTCSNKIDLKFRPNMVFNLKIFSIRLIEVTKL